jgi:CRISPR-associated protein Csh1
MDKREFCFELDRELDFLYRDYYFAFKVGSSNDQKKFLSTNNIQSFITKTFSDSIKYLDDRRGKKAPGKWLKTNISTTYDDFLNRVKDTFYRQEIQHDKKKEEVSFILDEQYLVADQKNIFLRVKQEMEDKQKDKTKKLDPAKIYLEFLKKKFLVGENTELSSIFLAKFNSRHIMEMEEYRESYINLAYYDLLERFFVEEVFDSKICHVCQEVKEVIGNIPLTMKFYGTTNELFFENLKNKNAYKSFAVCRECLLEVLTGMKYVENHLLDRIFDIDCFLIPNLYEGSSEFEAKLKGAARIIQTKDPRYKEHIDHLEDIMKKSGRKGRGFSFNMMFYSSSQNDFDILKYISNLELKPLLQKMQSFEYLTDTYELDQVAQYGLRLWDIRYYLFPSDRSHVKADFKSYGKDLLNFLENFLHENKIGYHDLIHKFIDIYRRRFNRGRNDILSPFKMVMFMTILNQIDILKEEKPMNMGDSISEITKQEYLEFFQTHQRVYEGNHYRQGLFLLGTIISKIVYAQRSKKANFMKKINLAGIPAHRVKNLIGEVKEYATIYSDDIYEVQGIWGNIMDRLQGIEASGMKGDEIVFYILTGISYEDYLGMKYGKEKKAQQEAKGVTDKGEGK